MTEIRDLALVLLDDDDGISTPAWETLKQMLEDDPEVWNEDIIEAIKVQDGRWYLPKGWDKNG